MIFAYDTGVRETTAEIWIGPNQSSDWAGSQGGINPTHLLLLRENGKPAWMLMPGNLHDRKPPTLESPKVWVPTPKNPIQDALLLFAVMGAKIPEVRAVFSEFEKSRSRAKLDLSERFSKGVPKQVYEACQRHLQGWRVVVNLGSYSLANVDISSLKAYKGLTVEIRSTVSN